jgi:hypothetical protein
MTGINIGLNAKYLPWQIFVLGVFGASIACMYYAMTIKNKGKVANVFFLCLSMCGIIMGIESLATNTGILAQYLPIIQLTYWVLFCIALILLFFFL